MQSSAAPAPRANLVASGFSRKIAAMRSSLVLAIARAALAGGALLAAGCSLGNVGHDSCSEDGECAAAFGIGSTCGGGYCSPPGSCTTGHDCREKYGGGACVEGFCKLYVPDDPACQIFEPPDLKTRPLAGDGAILVAGAIFAKDDEKNQATADAARFAIREIQRSTGVANGQNIGLVVCDNGGPDNAATGDERTKLDQHALDYLAGTLGVPFVIGPGASGDALKAIARLLEKNYPTVLISPSATSTELTGVQSRLDPADPYPLFWRTCPSDALQAQVLANDVIKMDMAITSVAVVYTNDAYGLGFSTELQSVLGSASTSLVAFDSGKLDMPGAAEAAAASVLSSGADAIVIVAVLAGDTVKLLTAMQKQSLGSKKFFLTDGSKNAAVLLDPSLPTEVKAIIANVKGTTPAAARDDATFKQFSANLAVEFPGLDPQQYSFLTHSYDATYLGAFGVVYAEAKAKGKVYDGRDVAAGIAHLEAGTLVNISAVTWPGAKQTLVQQGEIDVEGVSGALDLDPKLGEGPAPIDVWAVSSDGASFVTLKTVVP